MRASLRALGPSIAVVLIAMLMVGPSVAAEPCHKINAKGVGQDLGGGVTEARVIGGGLLHGTTEGNFAITGVSGAVASIAGTVEFTVNKATLTVSVTGTFNTSTGAFSASGPVVDSTGKLSGSSGNLLFDGVQDLSDGSFVEDITGTICLGR